MGYTATGNAVHFPNQLGNIKPWVIMTELHRVTSVELKFYVTQDVTLLVIDKIESSRDGNSIGSIKLFLNWNNGLVLCNLCSKPTD